MGPLKKRVYIGNGDADYRDEAQHDDGKGVASHLIPQGRVTDDHAHDHRADSPAEKGGQEGNAEMLEQYDGRISPNRQKPGVPDGKDAGISGEQDQSGDGDYVYAGEDHEGRNIHALLTFLTVCHWCRSREFRSGGRPARQSRFQTRRGRGTRKRYIRRLSSPVRRE